jgi:hypothetical protein
VSSPPRENNSLFQKRKSGVWSARPALTRGALRGRHGRWERDAMDVSATLDGCCRDGRRNRAVPIPRRWDQVLGDELRATVANKPGTPGRPRISRNTIAQGMPDRFGVPVVTCLRAFLLCTQGCGCSERPAFPAPSDFQGDTDDAPPGRNHAAGVRGLVFSSLRGAQATKQSKPQQAQTWIASRSPPSGAHSRDPLARNDDAAV